MFRISAEPEARKYPTHLFTQLFFTRHSNYNKNFNCCQDVTVTGRVRSREPIVSISMTSNITNVYYIWFILFDAAILSRAVIPGSLDGR